MYSEESIKVCSPRTEHTTKKGHGSNHITFSWPATDENVAHILQGLPSAEEIKLLC